MRIEAVRTRKLTPPKDDLLQVLGESLPNLKEKSVVAMSSKVVAIWQGRCEKIPSDGSERAYKDELTKQEADMYLERDDAPHSINLCTITHGTLILSAGIDKSNGNGYFALLPKDPMRTAEDLRNHLKKLHNIKELGVIITDSHSIPFRNGTLGVTLGYAGFQSQFDYWGQKDVFDETLPKFEQLNVTDSLAVAANAVMGEGGECTPIAVISDIPHIVFADEELDDVRSRLLLSLERDVYGLFFNSFPWRKGGNTKNHE